MKISDMQKRNVDSVYSLAEVPCKDYPEEGLIVAERIAMKLLPILSNSIPLTRADYLFFEGYRSKNRRPGFAIFGKVSESLSGIASYILKVEYASADLADRTDITERFFTGPQPKPKILRFCIAAPYRSPLCESDYRNFRGTLNSMKKLRPSGLRMGEGFYAQFNGLQPSAALPEKLVTELGRERGVYLSVVLTDPKKGTRFEHDNLREVGPTGLRITDKYFLGGGEDPELKGFMHENLIPVPSDRIVAIFGKGLRELYLTENLTGKQ